MSRSSEYPGNNFPQNQMVNGNLCGQPVQGIYPVRMIYVQPTYQPVHPSYVPPSYVYSSGTQYVNPFISPNAPVPPPTNTQPIVLQRIDTQILNAVKKRQNKGLPIIDPNTKKNVLEELEKNKEEEFLLRENAPEFVPSTKCTYGGDQISLVTETQLPELAAQDTVVDLNDTLESDALGAELSFDETEDNPSLTASIKQIPSNLEQKLNHDDEIEVTSNFKATILPKKQESHSSLPDAFRDESSRKRSHEGYSHSPPFSHNFKSNFQNFHPRNFGPTQFERNTNDYRQNNQNRFQHPRNQHPFNNRNQHHQKRFNENFSQNNERNYVRTSSEKNLRTTGKTESSYHNRTYPVNNPQHQKVDQECTAHLIKDENQNLESEMLKEPKYDENNNEITEESVNVTEESLLELTTDNSDRSLNLSCKYSIKKLKQLKTSPAVLSKPPAKGNHLLDSSLKDVVRINLIKLSHQDKVDVPREYQHRNNHENSCGQLSRSKSIIKMNLSIKEDVKLNEAENAWKPSHVKDPDAMDDKDRELAILLKNFRSLLNKITEENFEHLVKEINDKQKYIIDSTEKLSAIVKLLFEKSISEPGYASTYAKLCQALSTVHLFNDEVLAVSKKTSNPWKIYLISHCQKEFERSKKDDIIFKDLQDSINKTSDTEEIENLEDLYFRIRQRANGTVKFIGELYKMNMLTVKIMMGCIEVLLNSVTEENIERLCKLLTTVGEKLEGELKNKTDMDKYMQQLSKLQNSSVITTQRIKFDIMNVIDLRKSRWKPRENARSLETKPQKLQDLQDEENKKKRLMQQQLNDYQPKSSQNNLGRQRSQRSFDNDGFRSNSFKQIDLNKLSFPPKSSGEMQLGSSNIFKNFNKPATQTKPPPTTISNSFAYLTTDCDDIEPNLSHNRSGPNGKNNRKEKKNGSNSHGNNNNSNSKEKPKARTPSPPMKKSVDNDDDYFMIDLTDNEEKDMRLLTDKMQQTFKGKLTFDMLVADLKKIKITKNILGQVFTDLFDKKSNEQKELIELIGEICRKGLITKVVNVDALKLTIKSIPSIICDAPHAYDYFSEYCVYFYENGLITTMDEIESICQNQQNALDKIKAKLKTTNAKNEQAQNMKSSEIVKNEVSNDRNKLEQNISLKIKNERCLRKFMNKIQYKMEKKQKDASLLEEIYSDIDKEECTDTSNFIKDLTLTILRACYESKGKKSQKKTVDISKLFPLFTRYIDGDISSQIDCINALNEFAFSNPNIENCNLCKLFDLFYENDIISVDAFNFWRKQNTNSPPKREALNQTMSFFTRLEEADLSDDFNCTSSTIKED